jgi:Xaa-Pro aminopeptidase
MRSRAAVAAVVLVAAAVAASGRPPAPNELRGIPLAEYAARRAAAMQLFEDGGVVVRGSVEEEFEPLNRFRQNNWFMYLTGVEVPGALLVLDPSAPPGEREVLYLPPRDMGQERWTGAKIGPGADAQRLYGLATKSTATFDQAIAAATGRTAKAGRRAVVYTVTPTGPEARFSRDAALVERLRRVVPAGTTVDDLTEPLGELRRTKSAAEVELLSRAIAITIEAQREVARTVAPNRFEYEVEAAIVGTFLRNGAQRSGFPSIVGSGINATVLHYAENEKQIEAGDLVVVDIGAEYNYYTADITRTWPATGRFTARQREVYQLVLDAQEAAARAYRPGMTVRDLHAVASETMRRSPLRDSRGRTLELAFIHGLSHFLGMDVHDVGDAMRALKPGDVFTIEPGIYLPEEKLGVRIEDDYLVTETGLVKLSKDLPSTPDEIERMMGGR